MTETAPFGTGERTLPPFELEQIDDYSQYVLHARMEILAVLRALQRKNALITVYFDRGKSFFLTSVLAVFPETDTFIVDAARDEDVQTRALRADRLIFTAVVDRIKIQFHVARLLPTVYEDRPAYSAAIPDALLRLQRREFFRLATPVVHPVRLHAELPGLDGPQPLDVPLLDISGGGVGLMLTPEQAQRLRPGDVLPNCRITLPDGSLLVAATLGVRNQFDVTTRTGARYVRVGCEYIDLPAARLAAIYRYITRVERERKARLDGAG